MKKMLTSDNAFKIYSILIAVFLWVFVVYNQNPESTKLVSGIDISYSNASVLESNGLVILKSDRSPTVEVSAKGRRLSLGKLDSNNISATATIPEIRAGVYDVNVDVRLPINDVSITDKNPYTINVTVEHMKKINVPVEIKYTGNPKNANSAVQASVSPKEISVWGPESVINTVSKAQVELNVADAVNGQTQTAIYKLIANDGDNITGNVNINTSTDSVAITSSVYQTTEIPIEAAYIGTPPPGYTISKTEVLPSRIKLASKDGSPITTEAIYTEPIDVSNISENAKISARLVIPENLVNVLSVTEAEVAIEVEHNINRDFKIESISFENAESGKKYNAEGLPMSVSIYGAENAFSSYVPKASVDVSALPIGEHIIALKLDLPELLSASRDYTVTVVVTDAANDAAVSPSTSPSPTN